VHFRKQTRRWHRHPRYPRTATGRHCEWAWGTNGRPRRERGPEQVARRVRAAAGRSISER